MRKQLVNFARIVNKYFALPEDMPESLSAEDLREMDKSAYNKWKESKDEMPHPSMRQMTDKEVAQFNQAIAEVEKKHGIRLEQIKDANQLLLLVDIILTLSMVVDITRVVHILVAKKIPQILWEKAFKLAKNSKQSDSFYSLCQKYMHDEVSEDMASLIEFANNKYAVAGIDLDYIKSWASSKYRPTTNKPLADKLDLVYKNLQKLAKENPKKLKEVMPNAAILFKNESGQFARPYSIRSMELKENGPALSLYDRYKDMAHPIVSDLQELNILMEPHLGPYRGDIKGAEEFLDLIYGRKMFDSTTMALTDDYIVLAKNNFELIKNLNIDEQVLRQIAKEHGWESALEDVGILSGYW